LADEELGAGDPRQVTVALVVEALQTLQPIVVSVV
jgi:hypothetical protein